MRLFFSRRPPEQCHEYSDGVGDQEGNAEKYHQEFNQRTQKKSSGNQSSGNSPSRITQKIHPRFSISRNLGASLVFFFVSSVIFGSSRSRCPVIIPFDRDYQSRKALKMMRIFTSLWLDSGTPRRNDGKRKTVVPAGTPGPRRQGWQALLEPHSLSGFTGSGPGGSGRRTW